MVRLRSSRILGSCSGSSSFVTPLPLHCENLTAHEQSTQHAKLQSSNPVLSNDTRILNSGQNTIVKVPGSANASGSSSSKKQTSEQVSGPPIERRKRGKRKDTRNQEDVIGGEPAAKVAKVAKGGNFLEEESDGVTLSFPVDASAFDKDGWLKTFPVFQKKLPLPRDKAFFDSLEGDDDVKEMARYSFMVSEFILHQKERMKALVDSTASELARAKAAKDQAIIAKAKAEAAKDQAIIAKEKAEAAKDRAILAKEKTEAAKDRAILAKEKAEAAKDQAIVAKKKAEAAMDRDIVAKEKAEAIKDWAIVTKKKAEGEKDRALESLKQYGDKLTKQHRIWGLEKRALVTLVASQMEELSSNADLIKTLRSSEEDAKSKITQLEAKLVKYMGACKDLMIECKEGRTTSWDPDAVIAEYTEMFLQEQVPDDSLEEVESAAAEKDVQPSEGNVASSFGQQGEKGKGTSKA